MITYSKARLKVGEFYFNEKAAPGGLDIVRHQARLQPVDAEKCEQRHTILVNLREDEDKLLGEMNRTTRYQINRSEREKTTCQFSSVPSETEMEAFTAFWAHFAPLKKLPPLNRVRVEGMRAAGSLELTRALSETGETLVWHTYVRAGQWARLLHSVSLFRGEDSDFASTVARANRLLHWQDMKHFRESGLEVYDFGGWYSGQEDQGMLNINRFKEGFGGEVTPVYYADRGSSVCGSLALGLKGLLKRN